MKKHIINIPLLEKLSMNRIYTSHWGLRQNMHQQYALLINARLRQMKKDGTFFEIKNYPVIVEYVFNVVGKTLDWSNHAGMIKMIEDCLVKNSVFKDDAFKFIKQGTVRTVQITKKRNEKSKQNVDIIIYEPEDNEELYFEAKACKKEQKKENKKKK